MKEHLTIIKVGGKIVENSESLNSLLKDFAAVEGKKLLVHGGGRSATQMGCCKYTPNLDYCQIFR